jgi:protein-S-isoprenylcysteine O-methyltransferase Ste14
MLKNYVKLLIQFHKAKTGNFSKFVSLTIGAIFFLFILPGIFYLIADLTSISIDVTPTIKFPIAIMSSGIGLFFFVWATWSQLKIGGGTPAPNAPTQRLVVVGPYKYTRNPIEFGAIWYYLGFGSIIGTMYHGLICMLLGLVVGSVYHKFIEEKELLQRFGNDYAEYKKQTPFLFPRIISKDR